MTLLQRIRNLLFRQAEETRDDLALLRDALQPPTEGVNLTGYIAVPRFDERGSESAVFDVELYTDDGELYTTTEIEFEIPTEGLAADGARLNDFLNSFGIDTAEAIDQIVGEQVDVENVDGNWEVQW